MSRQIIGSPHDDSNLNSVNHNFAELYDQKRVSSSVLGRAEEALRQATIASNTNKNVQRQLDNLVIESGNANAEVSQSRGGYNLLNNRMDAFDDSIGVNPSEFGFSESASWTKNRDAMQQANDLLKSQGGGTISLPPGEFKVKGVYQDSNVHIRGNGTILKHPDGESLDIITNRVYSTNGTITQGERVLSVDDTTNLEKGMLIAVRGAGGPSDLQNTKITSSITSTSTSIAIEKTTGFHTKGFLQIGNEIIEYTGISGKVLTGVKRGQQGTTATSHSSGTKISYSLRLVATITAVSGTNITLDKPSLKSVVGTNVLIGVNNLSITNIMFDGNLKPEGAFLSCNPVRWNLVNFSKLDIKAKNSESAVYLNNSSDCDVKVYAKDVTKPRGTIGAVVWLFQNCHRNNIFANISGNAWSGVYLDNRTSLATEFDGTCDYNTGTVIVNSDYYSDSHTTTGMLVVGGNHNDFTVKTYKIHTGFTLKNSDQVYNIDGTFPPTKGNFVTYNVLEGYQPHLVYTEGNVITGYHETKTNGILNDGSVKFASPVSTGELPRLGVFEDGTYNRPAFGFRDDINTGFYRVSDGQVQFVSKSSATARFTGTGLFFADGKNLEFNGGTGNKIGTSPGQKMGFWGRTPITQPKGMPAAAGNLEQALELVNYLRKSLYDMGLIDV